MKLKDLVGVAFLKKIGCYIMRVDEDSICQFTIVWKRDSNPRSLIVWIENGGNYKAKVTCTFFNNGFGNRKPDDIIIDGGNNIVTLKIAIIERFLSEGAISKTSAKRILSDIENGNI